MDTTEDKHNKIIMEDIEVLEDKQSNTIESLAPIDGGYGWVIVLNSFILHCIILGLQFSYGIFLNEYIRLEFDGIKDKSQFALIGSISLALLAGLGFISGKLADRFGYRNTIYFGSILITIGLILASFSDKLWHLYLTQGLLCGIGSSIAYIPSVSVVSNWFEAKRGLATGIAVSGSGFGGLIISPILNILIQNFGIKTSLRCIAIASLIISLISGYFIKLRTPPKAKINNLMFYKNVFKDYKFWILWVDGSIQNLGFLVPVFLMPIYCKHYGLDATTSSIMVGILNGCSALGRIILGRLADRFGKLNMFIFGTLFCSLFCLSIWLIAFNLITITLFCILFGLVSGVYSSLMPSLAPDMFGTDNIASIIGLLYTSCGIANLAGPPIAASLSNLNDPSFYNPFTGMILFTSFSFLSGVVLMFTLRWKLYNKLLVRC